MQKARRHHINMAPTACKRTVSGSFHSPSGGSFHLSLTVLVHYRSLRSIQPQRMVPPNSDRISPVPPYSGYSSLTNLTCTRLSLSLVYLSRVLPLQFDSIIQVLQPHYDVSQWFGLIRVRSPLLAESLLFYSPPTTQMFQFIGLLSFDDWSSTSQVSPFGHLRITSRLHLPVAFRSLPRPSSSLRAQASPVRPYLLPILNYPKIIVSRSQIMHPDLTIR